MSVASKARKRVGNSLKVTDGTIVRWTCVARCQCGEYRLRMSDEVRANVTEGTAIVEELPR